MTCQKHSQLAEQANQQGGSVLPALNMSNLRRQTQANSPIPTKSAAELRAEWSEELEVAVVTMDSLREVYPQKTGLENLVTTPELSPATWQHLQSQWQDWVRQAISAANRSGAELTLESEEIDQLATYYLANTVAKVQSGELPTRASSDQLFDQLSSDQQELILLLDNERAFYKEKQINEMWQIVEHGWLLRASKGFWGLKKEIKYSIQTETRRILAYTMAEAFQRGYRPLDLKAYDPIWQDLKKEPKLRLTTPAQALIERVSKQLDFTPTATFPASQIASNSEHQRFLETVQKNYESK